MASTRRLTAILAADVAGYSRLMGADEEGTHERLKAHLRELIDPKVKEHQGRVVKNTGDGMLAEFASVVDAVRCATDVQRGMLDRNADHPPDRRIEFRIGINLGDVIADGGDIFGDGVNVAARLEALAEPGGICISRTVRDQIRDKLAYQFEDLGEQNVKNIARPVRAYALRQEAITVLPISSPPLAASISQPHSAPRLSIVVLPFTNLGDDREQQYFADGITEDLTTDLSRLANMFVISRNTAFTYRNKPIDTKQIGRELGVRYVLEGSIRRSGNQLRVNAQLIDAATDAHLWAERFDSDTVDLFALQNEITSRLANSLGVELIAAAAAQPTEHPDALDYILRGRARRESSPDVYAEAIRLFEHALALDPQSVEAQTVLANSLSGRVLDLMTHSAAVDIARAGRAGRTSLGSIAPQCVCAFCQRQGAASAEPMGGGRSRIRNGARVGSQLRARFTLSHPVQGLHRVDRGGHPARGTSHSPQPARSRHRLAVRHDWACAFVAIAHRRGDRLARKSAQRSSCRFVGSQSPRLRLCPQGRDRTRRRRTR
jgi:TolB-like protein